MPPGFFLLPMIKCERRDELKNSGTVTLKRTGTFWVEK